MPKAGISDEAEFRDAALVAFTDAVNLHRYVAIIEAGNAPEVVASINEARAGRTATAIRQVLLEALIGKAIRAWLPVRKASDRHLRAMVEYIENTGAEALSSTPRPADLEAAIVRFRAAEGAADLDLVSHMRHKQIAHLAQMDPGRRPPTFNAVFAVALTTAGILEQIAHGAGVTTLTVESQMGEHRADAARFWS